MEKIGSVLHGPRIKGDDIGSTASNCDFKEDIMPQDYSTQKLSATCSSRSSPNHSDECSLSSNSPCVEHPCGRSLPRTLIDLNLPVSQDDEMEPSAMEMAEGACDQCMPVEDPSAQKTSPPACDSTSDQPPNVRRHSTRNRPLTTKALEALACGFLSIKPKRKSRDDLHLGSTISRPSRRARSRLQITENFDDGVMDFNGNQRENDVCKSNGDMLGELQV